MTASTNPELLVDQKGTERFALKGDRYELYCCILLFHYIVKMGIAVIHLEVSIRYLGGEYTDMSRCSIQTNKMNVIKNV